ncbi:serine/threonine protein kinase [Streptomyces wuyuanensis]|uniref:serine/threonine protein kinase n=1 Tax=Streptomyces wuyuanensis TaxID=1196353 RepID=UPI003D724864
MPVERFGPYVVLEQLASGGMGRILLARSPGGRTVAVKTLLADSADDRRRFRREVRLAQRVRGIYTADVVAADPDAALPWMATEYIPAPSLRDLVERWGVLETGSLHWVAAGIAEALLSIHTAGLVHRDVKPSNVLLPVDGPRVIDFGISHGNDVTRTQTALGTVLYASPEQARAEPPDAASDVFSLGATLFHLAVGRAPYRDGGAGSALEQLVRTAGGDLDLAGLPAELEPLVLPCLELDPSARPTPEQVLVHCQQWLARRPDARGGEDWLPPDWVRAIERHRAQRMRTVLEAERRAKPDDVTRPVQPPQPTSRLTAPAPGSDRAGRRRRVLLAGGGAAVFLAVATLMVLRPWTAEAGKPDGPVRILPVESKSPGMCPTDSPSGRFWQSDDRQICVVTSDDGEDLTVERFTAVRAYPDTDPGMSGWAVDVTFQETDRAAFTKLTALVAGRTGPHDELAFVTDSGRLLTAPRIMEKITGSTVKIAYRLKENEARFLAKALGAPS